MKDYSPISSLANSERLKLIDPPKPNPKYTLYPIENTISAGGLILVIAKLISYGRSKPT
jgi:hypothetical protein